MPDSKRLSSIPIRARESLIQFAIAFVFIASGLGCRGFDSDPPASAEVGPPTRSSPTVFRIGTSGDYPPFSAWAEDAARPRGFSVELAHAFARDEQLELQWVRFRWPELLADLAEGRFELALSGVTIRPERSAAGLSSVPLATSGAVVLMPRARPPTPETARRLRTAAGLRLAVNAGGHLERTARAHFPHAIIEAIPNNAAVLRRLASGGADGVVTDLVEAPLWQEQWPTTRGSTGWPRARRPAERDVAVAEDAGAEPAAGLRRLHSIGPFTRDRKAGLWRPDRSDLARRFDAWLLAAEASGRLDALRRRHGLPPERTAESGAALLARLDERLSLMPAVARTKRVLDQPIEDQAREARVLAAARGSVAQAARRAGLPAPGQPVIDELFRAQMAAARWIQHRELDMSTKSRTSTSAPSPTTSTSPSPPPPSAPRTRVPPSADAARAELEGLLRPALIRIGDRLADLLVAWIATPDAALGPEHVAQALERHALPAPMIERLAAALRALRRDAAADASRHRPPGAGPGRVPSA